MLTINLNFLSQWKIRNESKPRTNMGDSIHNFRSICTRFLLKIKNDNMSKNEMILYYSWCMICAKHLSFVPIKIVWFRHFLLMCLYLAIIMSNNVYVCKGYCLASVSTIYRLDFRTSLYFFVDHIVSLFLHFVLAVELSILVLFTASEFP